MTDFSRRPGNQNNLFTHVFSPCDLQNGSLPGRLIGFAACGLIEVPLQNQIYDVFAKPQTSLEKPALLPYQPVDLC
jgi:hypothetical protein